MNIQVIRYDSISSTNTEAINQAKFGADEGLCVVANRQTDGRGREGRNWESGKGGGLYFSIVLRPQISPTEYPVLTLLTAVVVHETLVSLYGLDADIKWPNDILVNNKKICGILAETTETPSGTAIIVGIGINCNSDDLTDELASTATSILDEMESEPDRETLFQALTRSFSMYYNTLNSTLNIAPILGSWEARSTYCKGKDVIVTTRTDIIEGTTIGLELSGALLVRTADGRIATITAGDVAALRPKAKPAADKTNGVRDDDAQSDVNSEELCENGS